MPVISLEADKGSFPIFDWVVTAKKEILIFESRGGFKFLTFGQAIHWTAFKVENMR